MHKIFVSVIVLLLLLMSMIGSAFALPRLAVRKFEDKSGDGKAPADAIMNMMVTELSKAKIFNLVERENLSYIADEIALGQSGLMDMSTAPAVGKVKGAQYSMDGAITMYYYDEKGSGILIPVIGGATQKKTAYVVLDIKIIDNSTSEIVYAETQVGSAKRAMKGAIGGYKGFYIGTYTKESGGILAEATRQAVIKHVTAINAEDWKQ